MSFKLCEESSQYIEQLKSKFKLQDKAGIIKLAFAKGLKEIPNVLPTSEDSKGKEVPLSIFPSAIFDALIRQKFNIRSLGNERKKYYKIIIDFGAKVMKMEEQFGAESLLIKLAKEGDPLNLRYPVNDKYKNKSANNSGSTEKILLELGTELNGETVSEFWNKKDHTGQHIGITGKTGAGKTQFALELLCQIYEQSNGSIKIIFFDFAKGDVAGNSLFSNFIGADVVDITKNGVPFNPFYIEDINDQKIEQLKEIFTSIQKAIGPKQSLTFFEILKECYSQKEEPDLPFVYKIMNDYYEEKGKSKDILVELFHKLYIPNIFPNSEEKNLYRTLSTQSIIFDLHNLDSQMKVKELVTFLILNKIYSETIKLPDSKIDPENNTREIRAVIVIDEAHNYLNCKNKVLEKMLRELRSKGIVVMLLSQGFSDFDQKEFDYSSMLNWIFLMKSDNSKQEIEKALAINKELAGNLASKLSIASTGDVFTRRLKESHKSYTHFSGKMFWERK